MTGSALAASADAEQLTEAGRWAEALAAWQAVADADPDAVRPRARIASCLVALGRFTEAIEILEPLVAATPGQPLLPYRLATARAGTGDVAGAVRALETAVTAGLRSASGIADEPLLASVRAEPAWPAIRDRVRHNDAPTTADPRFRAFDFWVGHWEARTEDGVLQGHNRIEIALDGAAIVEHWTGVTGVRGTSLNRYDRHTDRWRQSWVDIDGDALEFTDGIATPGRIEFGGTDTDGTRRRLTFTAEGPDAVRQLSEIAEAGQDWTVEYDFRYRRLAPPGEPDRA